MSASKMPQNRQVIVTLLRAIDANVDKFHTEAAQNAFLQSLLEQNAFRWEGKGSWNEPHQTHETLRRVLVRLAQDRRPQFRDLPGDNKTVERVHALFRLGSALISEDRLRAYGYERDADDDDPVVRGKRKRTETEAFREFQAQRGYHARRSDQGAYRGPAQAAKRLRTSGGARSSPLRASSSRWREEAEADERPRRRRGRPRYNISDTESESEYEDARQYDDDSNPAQRNGKAPTKYDEGDDDVTMTFSNRRPSTAVAHGADDDGAARDLHAALAGLKAQVQKLSSLFFHHRQSTLASLAPHPSEQLTELYRLALGAEDVQVVAGQLLEASAVTAREFLQSLVWAYLRMSFLEADFTATPLWALLDPHSSSHQFLRRDMLKGPLATSTHPDDAEDDEEEDSPDTGWALMRQFLRRVALRQLEHDELLAATFLEPTAWKHAHALRDLLSSHLCASAASLRAAAQNSTSADPAQVLLLCKHLCHGALLLRGKTLIVAEHATFRWVSAGEDYRSTEMTAAEGRNGDRVAIGLAPGMRWRVPPDEPEAVDENGEPAAPPQPNGTSGTRGLAAGMAGSVKAEVKVLLGGGRR